MEKCANSLSIKYLDDVIGGKTTSTTKKTIKSLLWHVSYQVKGLGVFSFFLFSDQQFIEMVNFPVACNHK